MPTMWPDDLTLEIGVPHMFDAGDVDQLHTITVKRPGVINSVVFYPNWTMAGANTNTRTYTLLNLGQAGAGSTAVATLALTSGVNLTRGVAKTITVTAANATVAVGDVLAWRSVMSGTGLPDPGGRVVIQQTLGT